MLKFNFKLNMCIKKHMLLLHHEHKLHNLRKCY